MLTNVIAAALVLALPYIARDKHKIKHKSFEPLAASDPGRYVGRYIGIENRYWAQIALGPEGRLELMLHEDGKSVLVRQVQLDGARLTAVKVEAGGVERPFTGVFGHRIVNDDRRFGLLVDGEVRLDDDVVLQRVFYRRTDARCAP